MSAEAVVVEDEVSLEESNPLDDQPVSQTQLEQLVIEWVDHSEVQPNNYNPNRMTWHDRQLLRQSLLEDGWTQPIVTLMDGTIVDGEQRWSVAAMELDVMVGDDGSVSVTTIDVIIAKMEERARQGHSISESIMERLLEGRRRTIAAIRRGETPTLAAITSGRVPITRVDFKDDAHKMISTIRHNRARGNHLLDEMSKITRDLDQLGLDVADFEVRLGMDTEEIDRLLTQIELPDQLNIAGPGQAWEPVHIAELEEDEVKREIERSRQAAKEAKAYRKEVAQRKQEIDQRVAEKVKEEGTQAQKDQIRVEVEKELPLPPKPKPPKLQAVLFYVNPEEYEKCMRVLGDPQVEGFIALCKAKYELEIGPWNGAVQ